LAVHCYFDEKEEIKEKIIIVKMLVVLLFILYYINLDNIGDVSDVLYMESKFTFGNITF
jgi:hypothetical protein